MSEQKKGGNTKLMVLLGVAAVGLTSVAVIVSKERTAGTYESVREDVPQLFTNFKERINAVARIEMRSRGTDFIVEKQADGTWAMPNRFGFPVDTDKVRRILVNTSELEILERKTDDPDKLDKLGLKDTESEESEAVRVTFFDEKGAVVSNFIAGNKRKAGGYALYVRKESENQAYLVRGEGWAGLNIGPDYWLNAEQFRFDKKKVKSVTFVEGVAPAELTQAGIPNAPDAPEPEAENVTDAEADVPGPDEIAQTQPEGEGAAEETAAAEQPAPAVTTTGIVLARNNASARKFRVDNLPEGIEEDPSKVNEAAFAPEDLSLGGIVPADQALKDDNVPEMTAVYETFDGSKITVNTFGDREGDILARFSANIPDNAPEDVVQQAEKINAKSGWLFVLPEETAQKFRVNAAYLAKKEEKAEEKSAESKE